MTREEAIAILQEEIYGNLELTLSEWRERDEQKLFPAIRMAIKALQADAVQGEWVCKEREYNDCDGHYAHYWYECSVCGAKPPKNQWKNEWHSNYCPNCGARMEANE